LILRAARVVAAGVGGGLVFSSTHAIAERCGFPVWPALIVAAVFCGAWIALVGLASAPLARGRWA
jgi:hypothetical protein